MNINIRNLHNIVFSRTPTKSPIRVLQSIRIDFLDDKKDKNR